MGGVVQIAKPWGDYEIEFFRNSIDVMNNREIAERLGRTERAVERKRQKLGIKRSDEARSVLEKRGAAKGRAGLRLDGSSNPNWRGGISKDRYRYKRMYKLRHPERVRAREIAHRALVSGKIKKQPCEICGSVRTQMHHDDYDKPLGIRWVCIKHHREIHRNKGVGKC
jgi:hypothetical protein